VNKDTAEFLRLSNMRGMGKGTDLQLQEKEMKILLTLAVYGMRSGYDLHSGPQNIMSSSTWHYTHKRLVRSRLIEVKEEKTNGKRKSKLYGPTVLGLIVALANAEIDDPDKIATNWGHLLPLVLGKRNLFRSYGLEDDAFALLLNSARSVLPITDLSIDYASWFAHEFYNSLLLTRFFTLELFGKNPDEELREKWLRCLSDDREIVDFIKEKRLRPEIRLFKASLDHRKALLSEL